MEVKHLGIKQNVVLPWPHVDLDVTYTYDGDNLTEVEITGLGYVKTITYTYADGKLTGKTVVITEAT
jgi:hypothetical protein